MLVITLGTKSELNDRNRTCIFYRSNQLM